MQQAAAGLVLLLALGVAWPAAARDDKIDPEIKLYFGKQPTPRVAKTVGEWTSNKKTNAFGKSDQEACDIAFISAVISLQQRAKLEGGNAVINIVSVYKNSRFESPTDYQCGAGAIMAGVGE